MTRPNINVTPLIDVLLVLLIIFMVVSPLKPSSFHARIPDEPTGPPGEPHPDTLIVTIADDHSLKLNNEAGVGASNETEKLTERLQRVFAERVANGSISNTLGGDTERPFSDKIERTVFIKAPRSLDYGSVARVVDAVKLAGAYPISLQIDGLD
ncbi:MAG TPA: biopolymer transporter ExbD [Pyrinomonadaceae bacterium]|jgi:biopolymer transport protein ExbD|nr:biopolymer transporter ExbD [Pyrinomonadaceae bacterium]